MPLDTDRDRVAHLLRRAGFGLNQADVDAYVPLGVEGAVDKLLAAAAAPAPAAFDVWLLDNCGQHQFSHQTRSICYQHSDFSHV